MKVLPIALFLSVLLSTPVFGQVQQAKIANPGPLPDEFFGLPYAFKRFVERVILFFTFNNPDRLALRTDFAERRLAEGILMAQKGDSSTGKNLLDEYSKEMADIVDSAQSLAKTRLNDPKVKELIAKIADATERHFTVLEDVASTVPDEAKSAVLRATSVSQKGSETSRAELEMIPQQERPTIPPIADAAPIRGKQT